MEAVKKDYLKYHAPIKKYFMVKYKLTPSKIDMLLFLYSERYFDNEKYKEYESLFYWDYTRLSTLLRDDWVRVFRKGVKFKSRTIYCLSPKAQSMIKSFYAKLEGEEIPSAPYSNPLFYKNVTYTEKKYRDFIVSLNDLRKKKKRDKSFSLDGMWD